MKTGINGEGSGRMKTKQRLKSFLLLPLSRGMVSSRTWVVQQDWKASQGNGLRFCALRLGGSVD